MNNLTEQEYIDIVRDYIKDRSFIESPSDETILDHYYDGHYPDDAARYIIEDWSDYEDTWDDPDPYDI